MTTKIELGQVWSETVTSELDGENWQRLHFVTDVKTWTVNERPRKYVLSVSKDQSHQTEIEAFSQFEFTGFRVDISVPCIEQRSLEELSQIAEGNYSVAPDAKAVELAVALIEHLDRVKEIGGSERGKAIRRAALALRDVAAFTQADTKKLDSEIWINNIS